MVMRWERNARYYLRSILAGTRRDSMTKEERAAYWRDYWAEKGEEIRARRREAYRRKQDESASALFDDVFDRMRENCKPCTVDSKEIKGNIGAQEVARIVSERSGLPVSPRTVLQWAKLGKIPAAKLIGRYAFSSRALEGWLSSLLEQEDFIPPLR
jgi:hypothetical protein